MGESLRSCGGEKSEVGAKVRISKSENLVNKPKEFKGRYMVTGVVIQKCGEDSYIIRKEDGKVVKKIHYDLKLIRASEDDTET